MSNILRYLVIGAAMLALSLSVACKDDSSPAMEEVTSGAESGGKAGVEAGMEAGQSGGMKEGAKEGGTEGGKAAASEVVN